jgi:hypothetical protein
VKELIPAIESYIHENNKNPKPFRLDRYREIDPQKAQEI